MLLNEQNPLLMQKKATMNPMLVGKHTHTCIIMCNTFCYQSWFTMKMYAGKTTADLLLMQPTAVLFLLVFNQRR